MGKSASTRALSESIERLMRERNIRKTDLAQKAKISRSKLDGYLKETTVPNLTSLDAIARVLGVEVFELLMPKKQHDAWTRKKPDIEQRLRAIEERLKTRR